MAGREEDHEVLCVKRHEGLYAVVGLDGYLFDADAGLGDVSVFLSVPDCTHRSYVNGMFDPELIVGTPLPSVMMTVQLYTCTVNPQYFVADLLVAGIRVQSLDGEAFGEDQERTLDFTG